MQFIHDASKISSRIHTLFVIGICFKSIEYPIYFHLFFIILLDLIWFGDFKHNNIQYQCPTLQSTFLAKSPSHCNNQIINKIKIKIESIVAKNHKKRKKQYSIFLQNTLVFTSSESTLVFCTTFLIFLL